MAIMYATDLSNGTTIGIENGFLIVSDLAFSDCPEMNSVDVLFWGKSLSVRDVDILFRIDGNGFLRNTRGGV